MNTQMNILWLISRLAVAILSFILLVRIDIFHWVINLLGSIIIYLVLTLLLE